MKKENCKHGLMEGTCAYCNGLIKQPTPNEYGEGASNSLTMADFDNGSCSKTIAALRRGFKEVD